MAKGVDIEMAPLDEDHVRAKITWSEQDVGGGKLVVEVTVKNRRPSRKPTTNLDQMRERLPYVSHEPLPIRLRISAGDLPRRRLGRSAGKLCITRCAAPVARGEPVKLMARRHAHWGFEFKPYATMPRKTLLRQGCATKGEVRPQSGKQTAFTVRPIRWQTSEHPNITSTRARA